MCPSCPRAPAPETAVREGGPGYGAEVIRGYPEQPSPRPGEVLTLRVATDAPQFRVEFYRCGAELTRCGDSGWLDGVDAPPHLPFQDWGRPGTGLDGEPLEPWPAYEFAVPEEWRSGVYVGVLVEGDEQGRDVSDLDRSTPDGRQAKVLFVVRAGGGSARILYKLPLLTYHAYGIVAPGMYELAGEPWSWCFYNWIDLPLQMPPGLSVHRPGGGTGGWPYDLPNFDPYDPTPRQTFVHWDARLVGWLENEGYDVDFCTDMDLHREGADLLRPYRLLVSAGHDEYWSVAMRDAVEGWVAGGGNAAFFSGNTCWWRVVFSEETTFVRVETWAESGRPENSMIGVSFRNGGERDRDDHPVPVGYRVQDAGHWVYAGTGLRDGDVFGAEENLIGYECDGALFDRADLEAGRFVRASGEDGTPEGFRILGVGDVRTAGYGFGNGAATMGLFSRGGTVFTGSTTDWVRGLASSPVVQRITRNVLDRLSTEQA
jgi:hypothetical protein